MKIQPTKSRLTSAVCMYRGVYFFSFLPRCGGIFGVVGFVAVDVEEPAAGG